MSDAKVSGCSDCPMFDDGHRYEYELICNHPSAPNQFSDPVYPEREVFRIEMDDSGDGPTYIEWVVTPDWCPLKKEPLTITIENLGVSLPPSFNPTLPCDIKKPPEEGG